MNLNSPPRGLLISAAVLIALSGCASTPRTDASLESARMAVSAAHADPRVKGDAIADLEAADHALAEADSALAAGRPLPSVDHYAYVADCNARSAVEHGKLLAANAAIAEQENRRNAVLLSAREADIRRVAAVANEQTRAANDARQNAAANAQGMADANARADSLAADLETLKAKQTDRGVVVTLGDVLFSTGRSELEGSAARSIGTLSAFLTSHPERTVRVEGFTDSVGSEQYNDGLSQRRAAAVADALQRDGVAASRVITQGYGESYPVASNATSTGRQQNRRVEVVISTGDGPIAQRTR